MMRWLFRLGVVGTIVALGYGFNHRDSSGADPRPEVQTSTTAVACPPDAHTDEGAARGAVEGLHEMTLANLGQADVDETVETYIAPTARDGARAYLTSFRPPITALESQVLGWQAVAYTDTRATIRLATSDVATATDGTTTTGQYVTDAVVEWNAPAGAWRLLGWKLTAAPNAVALLTDVRTFCDA